MFLFEEYYRRHKIQATQFFYNTFYVILECNNINHIFSSKWINDQRHPGHFKIRLKVVNHNGNENNDIFNVLMDDKVEWNEYEFYMSDFFKKIKQKNKKIHVHKEKSAALALWELFVFSNDNFFSKQKDDIKNHLFLSLDKKSSYENRLYNQIITLEKQTNQNINKIWENNFKVVLQNYSTWIEKILEPSITQIF